MPLAAEMGGVACLGGDFCDVSGLPDVMSEWFFAIDMLALSPSHDGGVGMEVVWCGDEDGVDVFSFSVIWRKST